VDVGEHMPIQLPVPSFLMLTNFVDIWSAEWLSYQEKQKNAYKNTHHVSSKYFIGKNFSI
jgi:hypothetical protein